jgi:hypothetical protein
VAQLGIVVPILILPIHSSSRAASQPDKAQTIGMIYHSLSHPRTSIRVTGLPQRQYDYAD